MPLSDAEIVSKVKHNLDQCEPSFQSAQVCGKICLQTECHCPEALVYMVALLYMVASDNTYNTHASLT